MLFIYWVGNTETDVELVLSKHGILSTSHLREQVLGLLDY